VRLPVLLRTAELYRAPARLYYEVAGNGIFQVRDTSGTNLMVAAAMLNTFRAWRQGELAYEELCFDAMTGRAIPVQRAVGRPGRSYSSPASLSSFSSSSSSAAADDSPPPKR